ncbi:MAG TPA: hemolysin family protein, partial [Vicinamibacterales bacterium]|nr:hemolysin family protein [Vicinamibacterales bacterium]
MDNLLAVAVIALLIALNGLFVAAEFAIVGAPRMAIDRRARAGQQIASVVQAILREPREQDRFIATAQLGITFASLGLGMYGEHVVAGWIAGALHAWGPPGWVAAHAVATVLSVAILTYFHIVLGEMVPKSLALQRAERTVLWITPPLLATKVLLYPLVVGLNAIGNAVLSVIGIDRRSASHEQYYSARELDFVVRESQEAGALPAELGRLLHEIFQFGDLSAGEVMTPRVRVIGVPAGAEAQTIEKILQESAHTRYPLYEQDLDGVLGVVHVKDLLRLALRDRPVLPHHARPMPTVPITARLDPVLRVMREERAQMALVVDEYGGTAGILTLQDLFEEVVGRMDEPGSLRADLSLDGAGRLLVPGTARLDEVGERLAVTLSHADVDSVSGLVLTLLGRPPRAGEAVAYGGL